jgi:hypothetical protein
VLRSSERAQKPPEHRLETVLCVLRRKLGNGRPYGMSRLYRSNLLAAKRPPAGTSTLCNSFTIDDLPIPE